jgi:O-methyltransferase
MTPGAREPTSVESAPSSGRAAELYLDLLKRCLTRYAFPERYRPVRTAGPLRAAVHAVARRVLATRQLELVRSAPFSPALREIGRDRHPDAETMVGLRRLDSLQRCIADVLRAGVPGDLVETGVWRGGAVIFMRAVLEAYGDPDRVVWAADSFRGLPRPDAERYPADWWIRLWTEPELAVPLEEVQANFARYGLLDDRVRFLAGWFRDTLPRAPIDRLAVLRLDGDMYESTMDALSSLYPKLSVGGYLIVDDFGASGPCKQAVEEFRARHGIGEDLVWIDWSGVFWKRRR